MRADRPVVDDLIAISSHFEKNRPVWTRGFRIGASRCADSPPHVSVTDGDALVSGNRHHP